MNIQKTLSATLAFESKIFEDLEFWISPNISEKIDLESVILSAGGSIIKKISNSNNKRIVNLIALVEKKKDEKKIKEFKKNGIEMREVGFVFASCLKQELEFQEAILWFYCI